MADESVKKSLGWRHEVLELGGNSKGKKFVG